MTVRLPARQLALFGPKRQRGTRPPAAKEIALHGLVKDTLDRWLSAGWLYSHFPAGEYRDKATGGRLKRMGLKAGWPDFVLVAPPRGQLFGLELKRRGERPSEAQRAVGQAFENAGAVWTWVDSYEAALLTLKRWGAVRSTLTMTPHGLLVKRAAPDVLPDIESESEGEEE